MGMNKITVRLSEETIGELLALAATTQQTLSSLVRIAVGDLLQCPDVLVRAGLACEDGRTDAQKAAWERDREHLVSTERLRALLVDNGLI
jgi:hypothetical protein